MHEGRHIHTIRTHIYEYTPTLTNTKKYTNAHTHTLALRLTPTHASTQITTLDQTHTESPTGAHTHTLIDTQNPI